MLLAVLVPTSCSGAGSLREPGAPRTKPRPLAARPRAGWRGGAEAGVLRPPAGGPGEGGAAAEEKAVHLRLNPLGDVPRTQQAQKTRSVTIRNIQSGLF